MSILELITGSFWLWWLTGTLLWAFIGVLVCSSLGMPWWIGAVTGAVGWFVAVLVLVIVGYSRRQAQQHVPAAGYPPVHTDYPPVANASAVPPFRGGFGSAFGSAVFASNPTEFGNPGSTVGTSGFGTGSGFGPSAFATGPGSGFGPSALATSPGSGFGPPGFGAAALPPADGSGSRETPAGSKGVLGYLVMATAILGSALMAVSAFVSWIASSIGRSAAETLIGQSWGPKDAIPVSFALILSGVLVATFSVLARVRNQARYIVLAVLCTVPWFTLAVQLALAATASVQVNAVADWLSQGAVGADVSTRPGVWVALTGTLLAVAWALAAGGLLLASRQRSTAGFGRQ